MRDLYKTYKQIYHRDRKGDGDKFTEGRQLLKELCIAIHNAREKEELLIIVDKIRERNILTENYSDSIEDDIKTGNAYADIPYPVLPRWREADTSEGYLYLAVSDSKKGQIKIGATTMDINERETKYSAKFGYPIKIVWSKWVDMPFQKEKALQDDFSDDRVSGLTYGDSNEWYYGELDGFIREAEFYCE